MSNASTAIHRSATLLATTILLLFGISSARAQADTTRTVRDTTVVDTAAVQAEGPAEEAEPTGYVMTKSPTVAIALSIVPGGGQIYNEQYIKSALFIGAGTFFAVQAIRNHVRFIEKADEVDALPEDDPDGDRDFLRREREFYRDNRDVNIAYFIGVQILSMIDAYVGAHLFDFDVDAGEEGLSSRLYLDPERIGIGVAMTW